MSKASITRKRGDASHARILLSLYRVQTHSSGGLKPILIAHRWPSNRHQLFDLCSRWGTMLGIGEGHHRRLRRRNQ